MLFYSIYMDTTGTEILRMHDQINIYHKAKDKEALFNIAYYFNGH